MYELTIVLTTIFVQVIITKLANHFAPYKLEQTTKTKLGDCIIVTRVYAPRKGEIK